MVSLKVKCPHCGKSLMNTEHKLDGVSSIELKITYAGKNAPIYLSSKYGSYNIESDLIPPHGNVAGFRCPHCDADLKSTRKCDMCGSQMIALELKDGGMVQVCSRSGCRKHLLEFEDTDAALEAFYKAYLKSL